MKKSSIVLLSLLAMVALGTVAYGSAGFTDWDANGFRNRFLPSLSSEISSVSSETSSSEETSSEEYLNVLPANFAKVYEITFNDFVDQSTATTGSSGGTSYYAYTLSLTNDYYKEIHFENASELTETNHIVTKSGPINILMNVKANDSITNISMGGIVLLDDNFDVAYTHIAYSMFSGTYSWNAIGMSSFHNVDIDGYTIQLFAVVE